MIIDCYQLRKFFMRYGRKFFLSEEIKMEFKRIKMCKKQTKFAMGQLELMKMQMGYGVYEKIEKQRQHELDGLTSPGKKQKKNKNNWINP